VWVKHENHSPVGAFKIRGGLVYMDWLKREHPEVTTVVTATRGNHGQSIALAAATSGLRSVVVVPRGNSIEKNRAMRELGAELVEEGDDFQAALEHAVKLERENGCTGFRAITGCWSRESRRRRMNFSLLFRSSIRYTFPSEWARASAA
jgi:threonine dehydratase